MAMATPPSRLMLRMEYMGMVIGVSGESQASDHRQSPARKPGTAVRPARVPA